MENTLVQEMNNLQQKLMNGYDTISRLSPVEIATSAKTEVYAEDKIKLYKYHNPGEITLKTPVLIVYALVNTYKMLDLQPDRSYIQNLLKAGIEVYLIDWGYPNYADRYLSMDDYVNNYINNCVDFIRKKQKTDKINIVSICQGGTLSAIYTSLYPNKIKNLITQVTPIDFSVSDALLFKWSKHIDFDKLTEAYNGLIPGEFLNEAFGLLKPMMRFQKQQTLFNNIDDEERLMNFLRMEKWIADSPDQAGTCFLQFMKDLYQQNKLMKGELVLKGIKVNLKNITCPLLNIYATEDHLVSPNAAIPLNDCVGSKDKELYGFKGGHIGVFVGSKSQKELAPFIAAWLHKRDAN